MFEIEAKIIFYERLAGSLDFIERKEKKVQRGIDDAGNVSQR